MTKFLKEKRRKKKLTAEMLGKITGINRVGISSVENDLEPLGEQRAKIIGTALEIPEDVMTVYRGHLPNYAKNVYKAAPDRLEKAIRKSVKKLEEDG